MTIAPLTGPSVWKGSELPRDGWAVMGGSTSRRVGALNAVVRPTKEVIH